jgi:Flp pilus assembly protein TadG
MGLSMTARRIHADEGGQTVVLVALLFVVLLGFVGLAIDGGRFYAERRFLQNAVDAAALGCTQKLVSGGTAADAEAQGKTILRTYGLQNDPTGTGVTVSETPVYTTWFSALGSADKRNLSDGVVASSTDCRAAVQASMQTWFIRLFGQETLSVPANAHAAAKGGMLPVVVNRYKDPPGPSSTFIDYSKQETYQNANPNTCSESGGGGCPDAAASDITCTTGCLWGPETVISGQGYTSSDSDFRGFIALDVRDFSTVDGSGDPIHEYYNGASGMSTNQLKDQEASYVNGGYPGPDLVAYVPGSNPVQKGLQIATMSGNSAGVLVSNFSKWFRVGDKLLVQLFDGQVREIPDFTINAPSTINATSPSGPADGPTFRVGANQRFRDATCSTGGSCWVDLEMARDSFNDGTSNDTPSQLHDLTFDPDQFTPSGGSGTQVTMKSLQIDAGLASGIYSIIVKGTGHQAPIPTGTITSTHQAWIPLNVGGVSRDFAMNFSATTVEVGVGDTGTYSFTLTTGSGSAGWGSSAVSVAIDRGTCSVGNVALVTVGGTTVCTSATVSTSPDYVPKKNGPPTVTVSVPTAGIVAGTYTLVVRSRGTNQDGQPVVHVQPLTLAVGTSAGGSTKYVNVQGYVVFIITSVDSNTVLGRAISGYYADPNDPALNVAHKPGLIPWEAAPY